MAQRNRSAAFQRRRLAILHSNPVCYLCGEPIDLALKYPHPMSGTVDHVVPHSEGGSDARSNLRPAHNECNKRRSTRPIDQVVKPKHSREW